MEHTISLGLLLRNNFLTLTDIYWAGSLLPEILLTVQILSTQLQIPSTQSTKYRHMSTDIDFNVIFPVFSIEFQGISRIIRISSICRQ